ncbi:MAG: alpha/beta-hydrolase family protein [Candidatus Nanopelagicales bacterium]|nr:alpha/beta-hydrolase family protein [Candidatus Nanopelagicales bacterium]
MGRFRFPGVDVVATSPARAGMVAASASIAATFARGLLPRSVMDQALATGACSAAIFHIGATTHAAAQTIALSRTGTGGMRGRQAPRSATILADLVLAGTGYGIVRSLPPRPNEPLPASVVRTIADSLMVGGVCGALAEASDVVVQMVAPGAHPRKRLLLIDVAIGSTITAVGLYSRHRRATEYGLVDPKRKAVKRAGLVATGKAVGIGCAAGASLLALASAEQWFASRVQRVFDLGIRRYDIASPLVGHAVALTCFGVSGAGVFVLVKRRVAHTGDVIEPAYPKPAMNPHVSTGPKSTVEFDRIGKEGRRFVLMALTAEEISEVMGEPAVDPIRAIGPHDHRRPVEHRAQECLREMEALGAFDRRLICIASPTGVGYVSYTFAESLEYLTRGDCAIVVPEYALVPSALAITDTGDGTELQRRVLELARDHIRTLPPDKRPRLVQFGESLGAQVALDAAYPAGSGEFDRLGLDAGLYMGVPFRSKAWNAWQRRRREFDPGRLMVALSQPERIETVPEPMRLGIRHFMIIHHDDPVNKFSYRLVVKQPAWMGPPATRPPKVPRETVWRPVITFVLTLMDLKNGMDFKPGHFQRRGHDYRIDSRPAAALAYQLDHTPDQASRIDEALKGREQEWAARRLVARKFARARDSIANTLASWGVRPGTVLGKLNTEPVLEVAEINPAESRLSRHLDSAIMS